MILYTPDARGRIGGIGLSLLLFALSGGSFYEEEVASAEADHRSGEVAAATQQD